MNFNHTSGHPKIGKLHVGQKYLSRNSASDTLGCGSEVCQKNDDMAAKSAALPGRSEPMSYIVTHVHNIAKSVWIATWDW
jgi:hypothetical protein